MTELPSTYQTNSIYYVYKHIDPETKEIVYIGKGCKGRAWFYGVSTGRGKEHNDYLLELTYKGYTPDAWVELIETQLTEEDAFILELTYLQDLKNLPKYNSKRDTHCKLSSYDLEEINFWRQQGLSYEKIADKLGYSTMTIYRAANGQTKNYV